MNLLFNLFVCCSKQKIVNNQQPAHTIYRMIFAPITNKTTQILMHKWPIKQNAFHSNASYGVYGWLAGVEWISSIALKFELYSNCRSFFLEFHYNFFFVFVLFLYFIFNCDRCWQFDWCWFIQSTRWVKSTQIKCFEHWNRCLFDDWRHWTGFDQFAKEMYGSSSIRFLFSLRKGNYFCSSCCSREWNHITQK